VSATLRLASIGGSNCYHAKQFAGIFNSEDWTRHARDNNFAPMPAAARVVKVWDENCTYAEDLARNFGIEKVCASLDEAVEGVDGAILVDDCIPAQHRWAPALIERNVPFFLDKPMAPTYREALALVELARQRKALMFSSSAIRYSRELTSLLPRIRDEGGVKIAFAQCHNGRLVFYGIHPLELIVTAAGPGIVKVVNHGEGLRNVVCLTWNNGCEAVLLVDERVRSISGILSTAKAAHVVHVTDSRYYYWHLMRAFVQMILTGEIPVPWDETLDLIRVLDEAERQGKSTQ